jgi:hypothetical protein
MKNKLDDDARSMMCAWEDFHRIELEAGLVGVHAVAALFPES